jgi:hypothetical protein
VHNLIFLNVRHLGRGANSVDDAEGKAARIAVEVTVIDVSEARKVVDKRVFRVSILEEVHMCLHEVERNIILEDDNVRVVHGAMGMVLLDEGSKCKAGTSGKIVRRGRKRRGDDSRDKEQGYGETSHGSNCPTRRCPELL